MNAEDPLFILYTSGSTGKPKGVLHTTGGYLVWASMTHQLVFDYHDGDVFWCTADVGWVTGHSYIVYGPLANGATTLMFEGIPNATPMPVASGKVIDKHKVNIFYTAPTAIRALDGRRRTARDKTIAQDSLRCSGSVGEPINPEAWLWYLQAPSARKRCPIVDTWWQTETGGILITPLPGATRPSPVPPRGRSSASARGRRPRASSGGRRRPRAISCIKDSWPGQMRTVYGDHERFVETYFKTVQGQVFHRRRLPRDADGYYWITGRVDDVINVSGHRMGTAEVESALVAHDQGGGGRGRRIPARHQGAGHLLLRDPDGRRAAPSEALRKTELAQLGAARRSGRSPRPDRHPMGAGFAQDAVRARSCGASCARSPRTTTVRSATPRRSPIRRSLPT